MQKSERLMAITLLLHARGKMTARRLAEILGVSTRTIYRDIDILSLAHVPVSMDYGPGGGYYLPDGYHFESAIFTREEAVSLVLSADMAGNYSLFADDDGLQRALLKLEAALPEEYRVDVKAARERILFDTSAWYESSTSSAVYLEEIRLAILGSCRLQVLYPQPCQPSSLEWMRVDPYGLVYKGLSRRHARTGIWYFVGFCHGCQDFHTYRVSSIEDLKVCEEKMTRQADFDLRMYWQETRRHIEEQMQPVVLKLRVQSSARSALRGDYSVLDEEADGSVVVHVNMESLEEAVSYALSLGSEARVLSPRQVREKIAATVQAIAALYD
ncbi:MAG TPA: YafY family protein [Ktedonobacteraceae bacterium]|jgi:predicted DNA-binding transcriptional regulator YafY|nr:YafY family protein [Ktedonobacteraceae bacterium]